jgi:hypothetical protein
MRQIRRFLELPWGDRLMLVEAAVFINLACLALRFLPFRRIAPWLGRHMEVTSDVQSDRDKEFAERIGSAIRRAGVYLSWKAQCLAQAVAASAMLKLRGIDGTVYLGVAKQGEGNATAHAWLRSGTTIVTGERGSEQHSVVATFAFPRRVKAFQRNGGEAI